MTRRATFTQAELKRAIRAAEASGKVAVQTSVGIAFVDPMTLPQTAPSRESEGRNTCDDIFGADR
jgi:hypothetical protein